MNLCQMSKSLPSYGWSICRASFWKAQSLSDQHDTTTWDVPESEHWYNMQQWGDMRWARPHSDQGDLTFEILVYACLAQARIRKHGLHRRNLTSYGLSKINAVRVSRQANRHSETCNDIWLKCDVRIRFQGNGINLAARGVFYEDVGTFHLILFCSLRAINRHLMLLSLLSRALHILLRLTWQFQGFQGTE